MKLPAHAKRWIAERKAGRAPSGPLLITRKWVGPWRWHVVVPGGEDPAAFDLSVVAGLGCICSVSSDDVANDALYERLAQAEPAQCAVLVDGEFLRWL